ncbi:GGDEF/EAL domain-containing response regulator [Granulosicoccus sp. 3-233]|uniref:GGDEF/EAL domain-containing response regulator n=1 Tax=Granulosicoccus sp. 3-233 TaxID=3417969 RepID=UPI003D328CBB
MSQGESTDKAGSERPAVLMDPQTSKLVASSKIMMVDDEPINMRVLQLHLTAQGYGRFVSVTDSRLAMSTLRSERPSVLLLDLNMPDVSGLEILSEVRSDPELKQLPVIVLTSSNDPETKVEALQLGATDFLPKPVDANELALRMKNTIVARAYEQRLMHFDALTNLPNRLYFSRLVQKLMKSAAATSSRVALLLFNINRFKSINDTFGSEQGDDVLWAFSQRMQVVFDHAQGISPLRKDTLKPHCIARLGGARFGVLAQFGTDRCDEVWVQEWMPLLIAELEKPFVVEQQDVYVSTSVGISALDETARTVESLINNAETAMRYAKEQQSPGYALYSADMVSMARRALRLENAMRTALVNEEMRLVYQPKVDIRSGLINGAEALLRWENPDLGFVSPVDFVPVAESTGMIVAIGHWVLEAACLQAAIFRRECNPAFKIAVNVSIRQLYEAGFHQSVDEILKRTGLPPEALIIELTENMIMDDVEANIGKLSRLRDLGVRISVDDFGTGYSSLSYLQRFPIDQLKIDRSFIMEIESADEKAPIVKAIVSLAHDLGLSVVAEGIEEQVQLDLVARLGCEEYQGYLKSRPVEAAEFMQLMLNDVRKCA